MFAKGVRKMQGEKSTEIGIISKYRVLAAIHAKDEARILSDVEQWGRARCLHRNKGLCHFGGMIWGHDRCEQACGLVLSRACRSDVWDIRSNNPG